VPSSLIISQASPSDATTRFPTTPSAYSPKVLTCLNCSAIDVVLV
jgi:hypothetical protein